MQERLDGTSALARDVRLAIYRSFADTGRALSPVEVASAFDLSPGEAEDLLRALATQADALVLLPGSPYVWMAEPFSAVPTSFPVHSAHRSWYGNCIWDALAILAVLDRDGSVPTACPDCGEALRVDVADGRVVDTGAVVHFAVPAAEWWRDIGFT